MKRLFLPSLTLLLLLVQPIMAQEEGVAYVVAINGDARVTHRDGSTAALTRRAAIEVGDRIATEADAWLQLRFVDSAILSLSCNSSLLIRDYQYLDRNDDRSQLHLESGRARTITGTIQRSNYRFTAGQVEVRPSGTDFEVLLNTEENMYFGVYDGAIRITSAVGELVIGATGVSQYARIAEETGLVALPLRPAQFGNGVLGGIECP